MARQNHTPTVLKGNYPSLPITANAADVAMTAAIAADKEQFTMSGNGDIVTARNTGVGARTITFTSVANPLDGRTGDIATYSIGAGETAQFGPFYKEGWMQSDGKMYFECEHAEVLVGVSSLPSK